DERATASIWQGPKVRLRAIEPGDWSAFHAWNQDDDIARRLYQIPFPQSQAALQRWTEREARRVHKDDAFRWVVEDAMGNAVGAINTHPCDRRNGTFGYGVHIDRAQRGQGYAAEAIRLVLRYFFDELGYQKAHVHVYAFNAPSIRLHEQLGFQREGRPRRLLFTAGRHHDVLAYGLTAEEFHRMAALEDGRAESSSENIVPPAADDRGVSIHIAPATAADAAAILSLDRLVLGDERRADHLAAAIAAGRCRAARCGGEIVGFALRDRSFFDQWFVPLLIVHPDARRRGVGAALLRDIQASVVPAKLFTSTNASNAPMRRLCARLGFVEAGTIDHLDEGDPEVVLVWLGSSLTP
ncbi:MAG TPA: GNAT family N-acetyltransferase, partial [Thermomicrobiales bacterium]|nr:GNAT family N-acetyltransferase [Thermomicrobiales bacterium]